MMALSWSDSAQFVALVLDNEVLMLRTILYFASAAGAFFICRWAENNALQPIHPAILLGLFCWAWFALALGAWRLTFKKEDYQRPINTWEVYGNDADTVETYLKEYGIEYTRTNVTPGVHTIFHYDPNTGNRHRVGSKTYHV